MKKIIFGLLCLSLAMQTCLAQNSDKTQACNCSSEIWTKYKTIYHRYPGQTDTLYINPGDSIYFRASVTGVCGTSSFMVKRDDSIIISLSNVYSSSYKEEALPSKYFVMINGGGALCAQYAQVIYNAGTGVNNNTASSIYYNIYPNPFQNEVNLVFPLPAPTTLQYTVFNVLGMELLNIIEENVTDDVKKTINFEHLPSGIYYIRIETNKEIVFNKLIKN